MEIFFDVQSCAAENAIEKVGPGDPYFVTKLENGKWQAIACVLE